ncbi:MAG: hypothetical protein MR522_03325 [Trueperella sp.]|uniref:CBU_0592 family membrane protein n=1 Tax=Trueperella sp. TaxID=2699835 RepID=UPI0025E18AC1|nr:hypothetical protein [Trueperella sp.]MCI7305288.1 hypothetical protein [Trueperella sp.]
MNETMQALAQGMGWLGAALYLGGYYLVSTGKLAADSLRYQFMCISSGLFMVILASATGAWPSVFSNAMFTLIGLYVVLTVKRAYLKQLIATKAHRTMAAHGAHRDTAALSPTASGADARINFSYVDEVMAARSLAR